MAIVRIWRVVWLFACGMLRSAIGQIEESFWELR
jgi:hypothetical protein